ncbi:MAG: type IV secretion system protein [Cellvibrionaceae bacterium]
MATIAADLESVIDGYLTVYVNSASASIIGAVGPFFLAAVTIYFAFTGYMIAVGKITEPVSDVLNKFIKIGVISSIAMGVGTYQGLILDLLYGIPEGLVAALGNGSTIGGMIDNGAQPFNDIAEIISDKSSINPAVLIGLLFTGIIFGLIQMFFFVCAIAFFLLTKVALGLLLAVGPFFILLAMFPATQKYFENWVNQVMQFAIMQVLLGALYALLISIAMQYAQRVLANIDLVNWIRELYALEFLLLSFIIMIFNINTIASALTGGFGIDGISSAMTRVLMNQVFKGAGNKNPKPTPKPTPKNEITPTSKPQRVPLYAQNSLRKKL